MKDETLRWPVDHWPEDGLGGGVEGQCPSVETVRQWISQALPGGPSVSGPLELCRLKSWGLTARFGVGEETVYFKICLLPLFFASHAFYRVLGARCPGEVPHLLAGEERDGQAWTLFSPFSGTPLYESKRFDRMLEAGRALARVQAAVAAAPAAERDGLPRHRTDFAGQLQAVEDEIERVYAKTWAGDPTEEAWGAHLRAWRPALLDWAAELAAGQWPLAPDHVDFHSENILVEDSGLLRIVDWEETRLNCPFYSLDRLLADAAEVEEDGWSGLPPASAPAGHLGMGRCETALRRAYIEELPWKDEAARGRASDLALCLAPVKYAYESMLFNRALKRPQGHPGETAWFMKTGLERWRLMGQSVGR